MIQYGLFLFGIGVALTANCFSANDWPLLANAATGSLLYAGAALFAEGIRKEIRKR